MNREVNNRFHHYNRLIERVISGSSYVSAVWSLRFTLPPIAMFFVRRHTFLEFPWAAELPLRSFHHLYRSQRFRLLVSVFVYRNMYGTEQTPTYRRMDTGGHGEEGGKTLRP